MLIIDVNLPPHWADIGAIDASDHAIMNHAVEHNAIVLTHDPDLGGMLAAGGSQGPSFVSVAYCRYQEFVVQTWRRCCSVTELNCSKAR